MKINVNKQKNCHKIHQWMDIASLVGESRKQPLSATRGLYFC